MKTIIKLGIVICLAGCATPAFALACGAHLSVTVSDRIKQRASTAQAQDLLCAVGTQLGLDPGQVHIILLQVTPEEAAVANVTPTEAIREVRTPGRPLPVYLVWLVGESNWDQLAILLGSALADSYRVHPSTDEFRAAVRRAVVQESAVVEKNALLPRKH